MFYMHESFPVNPLYVEDKIADRKDTDTTSTINAIINGSEILRFLVVRRPPVTKHTFRF